MTPPGHQQADQHSPAFENEWPDDEGLAFARGCLFALLITLTGAAMVGGAILVVVSPW